MFCVRRKDCVHHQLLMCPVNGCTTTFESEENLDVHIAANLHKIPSEDPRTSNDIARLHLIETVRSTNLKSLHDVKRIKRGQTSSTNVTNGSQHYQYFSSVGWALRTRKHNNNMSDKTKNFIKDMWLHSQNTGPKLTPEQIHQEMRTQRDSSSGHEIFQPHEYATVNQIKYLFRKLLKEYEVTNKQQLIAELIQENKE